SKCNYLCRGRNDQDPANCGINVTGHVQINNRDVRRVSLAQVNNIVCVDPDANHFETVAPQHARYSFDHQWMVINYNNRNLVHDAISTTVRQKGTVQTAKSINGNKEDLR